MNAFSYNCCSKFLFDTISGLWKGEREVPDSQVRGSSDGSHQEEAQGRDVDVWSPPETLLFRGKLLTLLKHLYSFSSVPLCRCHYIRSFCRNGILLFSGGVKIKLHRIRPRRGPGYWRRQGEKTFHSCKNLHLNWILSNVFILQQNVLTSSTASREDKNVSFHVLL